MQHAVDIDAYARWLIKHKVARIVGRHGIRPSDAEDLEQDLALHALLAASKYDPTRGAVSTYYDRIFARKIATIVEARTAQKRDVRRERAIDDTPAASMPARELTTEQRDLRLDVENALAHLPHDQRRVARLFMTNNEAEVIRLTGMPRQRIRGLRRRIGKELRDVGLADYVSESGQPTRSLPPYILRWRTASSRPLRQATHRSQKAKVIAGQSSRGDTRCA